MHAPEEVVVEFLRLRSFETDDPASRWIHAMEEMPDYAILAARVQSLKYNEERVLLLRIHQVLQLIQFRYQGLVFRQGRVTRLVPAPVARIDLSQLHPAPWLHDELLAKIRQVRPIGTRSARLDLWQGCLMQVETAIVGVDVA
jgi:hypothetical protein